MVPIDELFVELSLPVVVVVVVAVVVANTVSVSCSEMNHVIDAARRTVDG